jgi:hypothetical protein
MSTEGDKATEPPQLSSTIEMASKFVLLLSGALYAVGLIIANLSAQRYGRYTLSLVEGQYVLVGMLWLALALLTFAFIHIMKQLARFDGPWRGRSLTKNLLHAALLLPLFVALSMLFTLGAVLFGVESPYFRTKVLAIFVIMMFTDGAFSQLVYEVSKGFNQNAVSRDVLLTNLSNANWFEISSSTLSFLFSLMLYSVVVYPNLSPGVGGGKLHQAEFIVREEHRPAFEAIQEFKIDKSGKLGPVAIVAESEQSFVITLPDRSISEFSSRSFEVKKDEIELVIFTK